MTKKRLPQGIRRRVGKRGTTYQVEIRIKGHRAATKTFPTLARAKEWKAHTESAIRKDEYIGEAEGSRRTVEDAITRYRKTCKPSVDSSRHLDWWNQQIGDLFLADVRTALITEARELLVGGDRSPATVNRYQQSLSHLFSIATDEWEWLPKKPRFPRKLKESRGRVRYLTKDELANLIESCEPNSMLHALVICAVSSGARAGELLSLTWKDVHVSEGWATLEDTKNGERRRITLTGKARVALSGLSKVRRIDTDLVFPNKSGDGPYRYQREWKQALSDAGIEDFRFHDLRHTCASHLAMNGATLAEIAEVLGHKTLSMVKRYSHLSESHVSKVVERMNKEILG